MAPTHVHALSDPVDVETEVARAAKLLLDLDRYADRVRTSEPAAPRLSTIEARLTSLQRLIRRLAGAPG